MGRDRCAGLRSGKGCPKGRYSTDNYPALGAGEEVMIAAADMIVLSPLVMPSLSILNMIGWGLLVSGSSIVTRNFTPPSCFR
jgi:hypothetical protein